MSAWSDAVKEPGFAELTGTQQLAYSDDIFHQVATGLGLDPGMDEYQNERTKWRADVMPDLKLSRTPVDDMGTMERLKEGFIGGGEDMELGIRQVANKVLVGYGVEGAAEKAADLEKAARAQASRLKPIYDTTAGTVGRVGTSLMMPSSTIPRAVLGGLAYGMAQPTTGSQRTSTALDSVLGEGGTQAGLDLLGERGTNALMSGAMFGGGAAVGNKVLAPMVGRAISPLRGARPLKEPPKDFAKRMEPQAALTKRAAEAQKRGFIVTAGAETQNKAALLTESVIESTPFVGGKVQKIRDHNTARANEILGEQAGIPGVRVFSDDIFSKARERIGPVFNEIEKVPLVKYDRRFLVAGRRLKKQVDLLDDEGLARPELVAAVKTLYEKPRALMKEGPAGISGAKLKALREVFNDDSKVLSRAGKDKAATQLNNMVHALDDMAERSLGKEMSGAYKTARKQWHALRIAEDSVDDSGNIVLSKYRSALNKHRPRRSYELDAFKNLRRDMDLVTNKVPNSFTAHRALVLSALGGGGVGAGIGLSGLVGALPGLLGSYAAMAGTRGLLTGPRLSKYMKNAAAQRPIGAGAVGALSRAPVGAGALLSPEALGLLSIGTQPQ